MRVFEIGSDGKLFTVTRNGTEDFFSPVIPSGSQQSLSDAGAVNVTSYCTKWTTTGAAAGTLADGTVKGQLKLVTMVVDGGDGTLTITTAESASLDVLTFADVGDYALLMWNGSYWKILATGNYASGDAGPAIA